MSTKAKSTRKPRKKDIRRAAASLLKPRPAGKLVKISLPSAQFQNGAIDPNVYKDELAREKASIRNPDAIVGYDSEPASPEEIKATFPALRHVADDQLRGLRVVTLPPFAAESRSESLIDPIALEQGRAWSRISHQVVGAEVLDEMPARKRRKR